MQKVCTQGFFPRSYNRYTYFGCCCRLGVLKRLLTSAHSLAEAGVTRLPQTKLWLQSIVQENRALVEQLQGGHPSLHRAEGATAAKLIGRMHRRLLLS